MTSKRSNCLNFLRFRCQHLPSSLLVSFPFDLGIIQENDDVSVGADVNSHGSDQVGKRQLAFRFLLQNLHQMICYHRHPNLDFDGILVVSKEVFQGEVLLFFEGIMIMRSFTFRAIRQMELQRPLEEVA